MRAGTVRSTRLVIGVGVAVIVGACAKGGRESPDDVVPETSVLGDSPDAVIANGAPENAPALFARARDAGIVAPCMIEPEPGTLYPKNWLPPRFTWTADGSTANLFELRVHADNVPRDIVVFTTSTSWTMPDQTWGALENDVVDVPITVELRGANWDGSGIQDVTITNHIRISIAPVAAPGTIVFWSISDADGDSRLKGLDLARQGVVNVLGPNDMPAYGKDGRTCIGCHSGTPDGQDVAVAWQSRAGDYWNDVAQIGSGTAGQAGARPSFMTDVAASTLGTGVRTLSSFSRAHWTSGDRVMLTNDDSNLVWVDLEATSAAAATGVLGSVGDPNPMRLGPSWSHDGKTIVYMSGSIGKTPFEFTGPSDLYVMPYADRAGATAATPATPLAGASSPDLAEYYPALSPDDAWVAFNALRDNGRLYDNPNAEVFIVPAAGGQRTRLAANDPPACAPKKSPGITNSWPKWAPEVEQVGDRKFYFLVFSSRRHLQTSEPQLYVAPIVTDGAGNVTTYPAVYLRNQEDLDGWQQWGNHTPAWNDFVIPPEIVVK